MMNNWIRNIMFVVLAMAGLHAAAVIEQHDTIYFYQTWEQVFYQEPAAMFVDPYIYTEYNEVDFETDDVLFDRNIKDDFIVATICDSIWLINSHYLSKNFSGDGRYLRNYVPLFFNDKMAFAVFDASLSVKEILMGDTENFDIDYYYIDFINKSVRRITHNVLSELLEDYHDLQMRYEGMKDYKKRHIIEDYFFKYIDRATNDVMKPYILDLVESDEIR